jgi:hypothetical protein
LATRQETLRNALVGKGCLGKAADREPVFVLRAQDKLAPDVVRVWADNAQAAGATAKANGAREVALAMEAWPHRKLPD